MAQTRTYSTGRRKTSVARVWLQAGSGKFQINGRDDANYFGRATSQMIIRQPFETVDQMDTYDVMCTVIGGGLSSQASAIRHGITRALMLIDPELRVPLKRKGFVTRDPRKKERKKYGQRGARAKFQFSKR